MVVSGVALVTVSWVAVDTGVGAVALKYQMLLVPPDALKVMGRLGQMDSRVPTFDGAAGRLKACALVPREGKLSQPNFKQVAV